MQRTLTAFYQTHEDAQKVSDALERANLGADLGAEVKIIDQTEADAHPAPKSFREWLGGLFGGHEDKHAYEEGLRRGHFLLTAKVDELKETRAAEILYAAGPLDLQAAQESWRAEGWENPYAESHCEPARVVGVSIRSYSLEPMI